MNRIVLIGNGFDLAHGLPTGYVDFINHYWKDFSYHVLNGYERWQLENYGISFIKPYSDNFADLKVINKGSAEITEYTITDNEQNAFNELCRYINRYNQMERFAKSLQLKFKNPLFEHISAQASLENWVDIENEYYKLLKSICFEENCIYKTSKALNEDLKYLTNILIGYLMNIQQKSIDKSLIIKQIKDNIFAPFNPADISIRGKDLFKKFLTDRFTDAQDENKVKGLLYQYSWKCANFAITESLDVREYLKQTTSWNDFINQVFSIDISYIPEYFLLPENILFLNFNYTNMADLYIPEQPNFRVNHIHGELNNLNNPIIFGYGDEMDDDYKDIMKLNENNYLENIKSICYLKTVNYRDLLSFINSAPYQIIIMGHSCGNSDRTLLNTLFEHENCLSIKPYYYQREDGTDNYIDIVQNISRDFKDMTLMRDRVVNKCYCDPLVTP